LGPDLRGWVDGGVQAELTRLGAGRPFTVPDILFRKIQKDDIETWKVRFGA
jgi:hypothetical protein